MPITVSTGIQYIDIDEFTNNVVIDENNEYYPVTGDGIFDDLMETATKHLLAQFKANRIRGENFATAYIEIYKATLQAALMAWLQKPEQAAKVKLIEAQTKNTNVDTLTKLWQLKAIKTEIKLKEAQTKNVNADTKYKEKQLKLVPVEMLLKLAQTRYVKAQAKAADKDEAVKEAQIKSEEMKTKLYKRQIEGYDENYKEKILKILLDAFTVVFSVASEGFKGGLPKVLTVSGINDLSDIITNDLNTPRSDANDSDLTNTSSTTDTQGNSAGANHHNTTVPNSYSTDTNEWDLNDDTASSSSGSGS